MDIRRMVIIALGTIGMRILMLLRRNRFPRIKPWKMVVISVLLTFAGVTGAMLMFWIENGSFGGTSFFGAILFVPVLMLPATLLKIPFSTLMDLCAPAECLMLAILKIDCMMHNCCAGKYIQSMGCHFPSQLVEMAVILLIMLILLDMEQKGKNKNALYGYYLMFYGITRFLLNWFRDALTPFVWILPAGNFWSLLAIYLGFMWQYAIKSFKKKYK